MALRFLDPDIIFDVLISQGRQFVKINDIGHLPLSKANVSDVPRLGFHGAFILSFGRIQLVHLLFGFLEAQELSFEHLGSPEVFDELVLYKLSEVSDEHSPKDFVVVPVLGVVGDSFDSQSKVIHFDSIFLVDLDVSSLTALKPPSVDQDYQNREQIDKYHVVFFCFS